MVDGWGRVVHLGVVDNRGSVIGGSNHGGSVIGGSNNGGNLQGEIEFYSFQMFSFLLAAAKYPTLSCV